MDEMLAVANLPREIRVLIYEMIPYKSDVVEKWRHIVSVEFRKSEYFLRRKLFYDAIWLRTFVVFGVEL